MGRLRLRRTFTVILCLIALVFAGCGDPVAVVEERATSQPQLGNSEAVAQATHTAGPPTPTVEIKPTDSPVLPPPTPTPLPTNTPIPTPTPESTKASDETAQQQDTPTPEPAPVPAPQITDVMIEIPAGAFILGNDNGDPNEGPAQQMELPVFLIDAFEVTNEDFATFVETTGYVTYRENEGSPQNWQWAFQDGKERHPVVFVTFEDAQAFCAWAGKRLPTEFEWEKAAHGPEAFVFPWGNAYDPAGFNGRESGIRGTVVVGSYPPNAYGLFDVAGNVKEWIDSPYVAYPNSAHQDNFYSEAFRGIRGGGWFDEGDFVSTTNRNGGDPAITANDDIGFRCAKDAT